MSERYDHLVVGGGHNGLACAFHLARGGRTVLVVEAAGQVGGAAATREFAPGYRVSAGAHMLDALPAALMREMELERHGLKFSALGLGTVALHPGSVPLRFSPGRLAGAPARDAAAYEAFCRQMDRHAGVVARLLDTAPFRLSLPTWREKLDGLRLAWDIRRLGRRDMRELLRIAGMNAHDLLTEHFESDSLKGALAWDATLGAESGPRAPGTVLTLLHRRALRSRAGSHGIAQPAGGLGAVTLAMARAAGAAGVTIRTGARVERILVEAERACGVRLASGETIRAGSVVSNADPKTTYLKLLGPEHLETDFVRRIDHFRSRGLVAKLHLALDAAPVFRGLEAADLGGRLLVSPSLQYLELAFNPSKYREVPAEPAMEITVPTVNDPGLAPAGRHVMSINLMFVPYDLGPDPQGARAALLRHAMAVLERHAPGIGQQVTARELLTPADLEREFGMAGGHWHHGALSFDQFFFTRPVPGAAQYASPVPGLHLCGAGCHPGGGVSGLAGRLAARAILQDRPDSPREGRHARA
jgi:phytoene dehydrogenase-like protein